MSRSRKKTPYNTDTSQKFLKKVANKRDRRLLKNPDNSLPYSSYKKAFQSWDICDYKNYGHSFEEFYKEEVALWRHWRTLPYWKNEPKPTREECWLDYLKQYLRK